MGEGKIEEPNPNNYGSSPQPQKQPENTYSMLPGSSKNLSVVQTPTSKPQGHGSVVLVSGGQNHYGALAMSGGQNHI